MISHSDEPRTVPIETRDARRETPLLGGRRALMSVAIAIGAAAACNRTTQQPQLIQTAPVEQRDIVVEAQASGTVEPVDTVAVKSKAGGLVIRLPVEVGSTVRPGDLLVQIDTRDLQNQYEQERANLTAAQARLTVAAAARTRASQLSSQRIITTAEAESAVAD